MPPRPETELSGPPVAVVAAAVVVTVEEVPEAGKAVEVWDASVGGAVVGFVADSAEIGEAEETEADEP